MARTKQADRLDEYERRYRELAGQLANIGLSTQGASRAATPAAAHPAANATLTNRSCTSLLPVDGQGRRQDRHPKAQPSRSRALQRMDRQ